MPGKKAQDVAKARRMAKAAPSPVDAAGLAAAPPTAQERADYDKVKERARQRNAALSLAGRDIGPLPEVVDPERKEACRRSFRAFCERYFPATFSIAWSEDHLRVIRKIEDAVLHGGLCAIAMPRGSGKTTLCETACLWSLAYGHRLFIALIGSDEGHALQMLDSIKTELEGNDALAEDFPEACYPIRSLEGIHQRASGQLCEGKQTHISWTASEIILPTIAGSPVSGSTIRVAGLTGRIRGMKHKRIDGTNVRPELVLIDDPQTDESARSPAQCATRERILAGAILGLAGPGHKIAGLMTLTVVRPDDLADRILDRDKHPAWQGERTKLVYAFPTNDALWGRYAELRAEGLRAGRGLKDATEFYASNREAMDAGSVVAWPERKNPDELSAIQHAMNLRLQDEAAFFAEYQNEPLSENAGDAKTLTAAEISARVNGHDRACIPIECSKLTMFVDVQGSCLWWLIAAWSDDFSGAVVDYGTFPDQRLYPGAYFTMAQIKHTLADLSPTSGQEAQIYGGLGALIDEKLAADYRRDDGAAMRIDRCLIDAGWGKSTDTVYLFCRQSAYGGVVMPSHGRGVTASSMPFSEYTKKRGEKVGLNWRIPIVAGKRAIRHVVFDANFWKSFVHDRFATAMGDPGSITLFGRKPDAHRIFADHMTAEYPVMTEGRGRTVDEWKPRVEGRDNHLLDCMVGAAIAASMLGCQVYGTQASKPERKKRRRISLAALQEARR